MEASSAAQFVELNEDPTVIGMLDSAGFVGQRLSQENSHVAVQQIMMHEVLNKRRCEMADISSGMETLSLLKLLSMCPDVVSIVFRTSTSCAIDPSLLRSMMTADSSNYIGISENENALRWLNMYIDECAKGNNQKDFYSQTRLG